MRTQKQWVEYKQLEQIPLTIAESHQANQARSSQSNGLSNKLSQWLQKVGRPIARLLEANTEPQIWKTYDQQGNPIWHAHDPLTGQESEWISEDDVRVWLEQRYYQPGLPLPLAPLEQR